MSWEKKYNEVLNEAVKPPRSTSKQLMIRVDDEILEITPENLAKLKKLMADPDVADDAIDELLGFSTVIQMQMDIEDYAVK